MAKAHSNHLKKEPFTSGLIQYASSASPRDLKSLIEVWFNLDTVNASSLHRAVLNPNTDVLESLLVESSPLMLQNEKGHSPLLLCMKKGTQDDTWLLIATGEVHAEDRDGPNAIHNAALCSNFSKVISRLIIQDANIDKKNTRRTTFLVYARFGRPNGMVSLLDGRAIVLDQGQNVTSKAIKYFTQRIAIEPRDFKGLTAPAPLWDSKENLKNIKLLNKGRLINVRDNLGNSVLHMCAVKGTVNNMRILLRRGCDIETKNADGQTPLFLAIFNKNAKKMIGFLLSQGASINSKDSKGNSPLHLCAGRATLEMVKFLVDNGSNTQEENAARMTPLHIALCLNTHEVVEYLLSVEPLEGLRAKCDNQAILHCIRIGKLRNLQLLFSRGIEIRSTDDLKLTALHHAVKNKERGVVELVSGRGISLEARCDHGATPFLHCAAEGTLENLIDLVEKGADVHSRDYVGKTAMHYAVSNEDIPAILEFLLEKGLSINDPDDIGRTPLHRCAMSGSLKNMKALIDKGANIKAMSDTKLTSLHFASANVKTSEILNFLLSQGLNVETQDESGHTALHHSIIHGNLSNVKLLVQRGASVEAKTKKGVAPMHLAAFCEDTPEKLQYLLEVGASPTVRDTDGMTPLLACALKGNLQKMKLLIKHGADILEQDHRGVCSLHYAAVNEKTVDIMQYLLDEGIPLEVRDKLGRTPLHHSAADGNVKSVAFLCEKGADLKSTDINKKTALDHADMNVEDDLIIEYLCARESQVDARDDMGLSPSLIPSGCDIAQK